MKSRKLRITIDALVCYETDENGAQIESILAGGFRCFDKLHGTEIIGDVEDKDIREIQDEINQLDSPSSDDDLRSIRDDEKYLAYKECTI